MSHLARRHPVQHLLQSAPPPRVAISGKLRRGLAIGRGSFVLKAAAAVRRASTKPLTIKKVG